MPANSAFIVTYPSAVTIPSSGITPCTITIGGNTYTMTTCSVSGTNIKIDTGLGVSIEAGQSIQIMITSMTNPPD
jgi:hypothetical protein